MAANHRTQTWDNSTTLELLRLVQEQFAQWGVSGYQSFEMSFGYITQIAGLQGTMLGYQDTFIFIGLAIFLSMIPAYFINDTRTTK